GVQPPGRIHDEHVKLPRLGFFAGVVRDAGWVAALLTLDDFAAESLAPDSQLLDRGRPEGIAGRDHYLLALFLAAPGQLGDRCGLAGAIDAGHHHNRRPGRVVAQALFRRGEQPLQLLLNEPFDVAGNFLVEERLANALDDLGRGG